MIAASSEAAIAGPKLEPKTDKAKSDKTSNFFMIIFLSFYGTATALNVRRRCYASRTGHQITARMGRHRKNETSPIVDLT
jgi:hypothetical protein